MKTPPPDRKHIVKELEERLKKKWAAEKSDELSLPVVKKAALPLGKKLKLSDQ